MLGHLLMLTVSQAESAGGPLSVDGLGPPWLDQLLNAVPNKFLHRERGGRALHPFDGEDASGDSVEVVSVTRDDMDEQISDPGQAEHLQHFRNRAELSPDAAEGALGHCRENVCAQGVVKEGWIDAALERTQRARLVVAIQSRSDRIAGEAVGFGDRDSRRGRLTAERAENRAVGGVGDVGGGHVAQFYLVRL